MKTVITFGTFDLFHIGHVRILQRAAEFGDTLIVGVSSDKLNYQKKQKNSIFNQNERLELVLSQKCVDAVFLEESLEKKIEYVKKFKADILIMGDDWKGKFDKMAEKVIYLPRTNYEISTTKIIENIREVNEIKEN